MNKQNMKKVMRIRRQLKHVALIITALVIIAGGVLIGVKSAKAASPVGEKVYTSIQVKEGDTLWSIAQNFVEGDVRDYIEELKDINGIVNERSLKAGSYITVFYFS